MVSFACPPICPLHAACARLPATQTHSAMCVCFTHPHCMSVLCGQVWPVLPGGDHCPRSPSGLKSGHWNLRSGITCFRAWTASSSPRQEVKLAGTQGQVASTERDPHCCSGGEALLTGHKQPLPTDWQRMGIFMMGRRAVCRPIALSLALLVVSPVQVPISRLCHCFLLPTQPSGGTAER